MKTKACFFRKIVGLFVWLIGTMNAIGQPNMGVPDIRNYHRMEYRAGSSNWGLAQDDKGIMYFGNNDGLLSFDGNTWRLYPLPSGGNVRSLAIDKEHIYIGAQEEIGYFSPGLNGDLQYHSLKNLIPQKYRHDFADVWNVVVDGTRVFFRSNRNIFLLEKGKITAFNSVNWSFLGKVKNRLLAYDDTKGLCQYINGDWQLMVARTAFPVSIQLSGLVDAGNSIWLVTKSGGLFKWDFHTVHAFSTPAIDILKNNMISGAVVLSASKIALATNLSGCVVLDTSGQLVDRFSHRDGLQSNNVLSVFEDRDKNVWLGLGDGVDVIEYNKPIRNISPGGDGPVAGFTSAVFQSQLFLGTATGLYKMQYDTVKGILSPYEKLSSPSELIWNVSNMQGQLWIGDDHSASVYRAGKVVSLNKKPTGFWNFQPLPGTDYIVSGTYNGLHYFKMDNGRMEDVGIEALFESARYVVVDGRTIWAMHPYKGLYKIELSEEGIPVRIIHLQNGAFLSPKNNHLFRVANRIVITSEKGIFEWNSPRQTFVPSQYFIAIFENRNLDYIKENSKGDYWFMRNGKMGVALKQNNGYKRLYFPDLDGRLLLGENESLSLMNDSCAIVAAEKGFFYVDYSKYTSLEKDFDLLVRSFHIQTQKEDRIIFGGYASPNMKTPNLAYKYNSVLITYGVPMFGYATAMQYSSRLEGIDHVWSNWSNKTEKSYTNLPPGKYKFRVRARNQYSEKEKETSFEFVVLAPWYRTVWAYGVYVLLIVSGVYWFAQYQRRRYIVMQTKRLEAQKTEYDKRQRELEFQHRLEQEQQEKELAKINSEKLALELEMKNTMIASNAMLLVQKGELLSKVKKDLSNMSSVGNDEKAMPQIKKIIRALDSELNNKEDWDKFASYFDTVHENYLKKLKERHPQLTPGDLKLCALLRLGMSSKEIAGILNISLKGVEVSRYRLRKKLNMEEEQSLFDYLIQ